MCRVGCFMTHTQESTLGANCTCLFCTKNTIYYSSCKVIMYFIFLKRHPIFFKTYRLLLYYTIHIKHASLLIASLGFGAQDSNQGANKSCFTHHHLNENSFSTNWRKLSAFIYFFPAFESRHRYQFWAQVISLK